MYEEDQVTRNQIQSHIRYLSNYLLSDKRHIYMKIKKPEPEMVST